MTRKEKLEKDIALLEESVAEKWLPILHGNMKDKGSDSCPLCKEYPNCVDCPIRENTGEGGCCETPYVDEWNKVAGSGQWANSLSAKKAALSEAIYLKDLASELREEKKKLERKEEEEEEKKKTFHPLVFYVGLHEPTPGIDFRIALNDKLHDFLEKEGLKVKEVNYTFQKRHKHFTFNTQTGFWRTGKENITQE